MSVILEVRNLTHTYGEKTPFINDAIKNLNFKINKGEIIGIIGHTGSGKSTLVQHLNGLLKPTSGTVLLMDKDIWAEPKKIRDVRFKVGLVFQYPEYQLFEETVFADIAFGPKNMGIKDSELENRVNEIASLVGIKPEYMEKSPFDLSGGEKRRVAIAGVMAMRPEVLILDEPVAGLDPKGRADIVEIIKKYAAEYNATVMIVSHNMEDMAVLADKLIVMNKGEIDRFDTTYNVFSDAEHLKSIGLNVPIVTNILRTIKAKGYDVREDIFTVGEALEYLLKAGCKND